MTPHSAAFLIRALEIGGLVLKTVSLLSDEDCTAALIRAEKRAVILQDCKTSVGKRMRSRDSSMDFQ